MSGELIERCTCAEAWGEDPSCALHGIATPWALENTLPSQWQEMVADMLDDHKVTSDSLDACRTSLTATAGACAEHVRTIARLRAELSSLRAIPGAPPPADGNDDAGAEPADLDVDAVAHEQLVGGGRTHLVEGVAADVDPGEPEHGGSIADLGAPAKDFRVGQKSPDSDVIGRLVGAVRAFMPTNISYGNANIPDDVTLPMDVSMGELRAIDAALASLPSAVKKP